MCDGSRDNYISPQKRKKDVDITRRFHGFLFHLFEEANILRSRSCKTFSLAWMLHEVVRIRKHEKQLSAC